MIKSVLDYLEKSAEIYSEKEAIVDVAGSYTYETLLEHTQRIGSFLIKQRLESNKPVVVLMDKCKEALASFWGITYAGGIYVPLDVHAPKARLDIIFQVIQPAYVITDEAHFDFASKLMKGESILLFSQLLDQAINKDALVKLQRQRIDTDPAYIICTSGSTGIPKGVVISHRAIIDFVEEASEEMEFSEKEIFANQAPFYFDASVPDLYCTIRNGATLHIIPSDWFTFPIRVLEYIKEHQINAIYWVPSALIVTANLRALREVDVS